MQMAFKPLDEIAELIGSLTYGEMVEVASELRKAPVETKQIDKLATLIRLSDLRRNDRTRLRIAGKLQKRGKSRRKLFRQSFTDGRVNT